MRSMKMIFTTTALLLGASTAMAQDYPGEHTAMCQAEMLAAGQNEYAVYDGDWMGLWQTAIIPSDLIDGQPQSNVTMFTATAGMPEWGVEAGCNTYVGSFDGQTFMGQTDRRPGETITYVISDNAAAGELTGNGTFNESVMTRQRPNVAVR